MKIQIIISSTREGRLGDKIAKAVFDVVSTNPDAEYEIIDLRDYPLPFYDEATGPSYLNGKYKHEEAFKWSAKVQEADGFIFVVAEYNHGYPAVFKNALDYLFFEWNYKPVAFVSYGGAAGGSRSVEQLRQVVDELKMVSVRESVVIPGIWGYLDDQGKITQPNFSENLQSVNNELLKLTKNLKVLRENGSK